MSEEIRARAERLAELDAVIQAEVVARRMVTEHMFEDFLCCAKGQNTTETGIDVTSVTLVDDGHLKERVRILNWVETHSVDEEYTGHELVWVDDLVKFIGGVEVSDFLDRRVAGQAEHVKRIVTEFPMAKYAVEGLVAAVRDAERERVIDLLHMGSGHYGRTHFENMDCSWCHYFRQIRGLAEGETK